MTAKENNLQRLYQARTAHIKWINIIKLLISNEHVEKKEMCIIPKESVVGKWFYNEAIPFSQFNSKLTLDEIEEYLKSMYEVYMKIYVIYFEETSPSLKSFFGFKKTPSKYEIEFASTCYEEIVEISDKFSHKLKQFESQLLALSDEKHERVRERLNNRKKQAKIKG